MKLASCYILSIGLHVMVLAYPVMFHSYQKSEPFRVTIVPVDDPGLDGTAGGDAASGKKSNANSNQTSALALAARVRAKPVDNRPEPQIVSASTVETVKESPVSLVSATTTSLESEPYSLPSTNGNGEHSASGGDGMGTAGNGNGMGSSGSGTGSGSASGGSGSGAGSLTQARYRDAPRPEYPDDARRQGREGRVLLRVFVDQQGEPKTVEVSRSSGSNALDMAATKAIKRWRFHPARKGDRPVDSWVNVPVDFHLTDPKN
jgi:periplasmic protein TonB